MATGSTYVNAQLIKLGSDWRLVDYDAVTACFQKGDAPVVVHLPFDTLLTCKSVVGELDELFDLIEVSTPR
jgi:hypothetical protein